MNKKQKTNWLISSKGRLAFGQGLLVALAYWVIGGIGLLGYFSSLAFAQSPSPTAIPTISQVTPTVEPEVKESLQERLKKAAEEKTGEAQKILGASARRAVVGTVKDISQNSLAIQTKSQATKMISISDKTVVVKKGKTVAANELAIGEYTIVMGYPGDKDILDARRIVVVDKPTPSNRIIALGAIIEINVKNKTYILETARPAELGGPEKLTISVPKKVDLDLTKLNIGDKMIIVATPGEKDTSPLNLKTSKIL